MHAWQNRLKSSTAETTSGAPPFITFFCRGHRVRDIAKPGKGARLVIQASALYFDDSGTCHVP